MQNTVSLTFTLGSKKKYAKNWNYPCSDSNINKVFVSCDIKIVLRYTFAWTDFFSENMEQHDVYLRGNIKEDVASSVL